MLFLALNLKAQSWPVKTWEKAFSISRDDDVPKNSQPTPDGGFILSGVTRSRNSRESGRWDSDYLVIKLDGNGNRQWRRNFGGIQDDNLKIIRSTTDGGSILGGNSRSFSGENKTQATHGENDYWVVRLDANGNKLWERSLGGRENENLTALYQTPDGGFLVGGTSSSGISGNRSLPIKGAYDYWVVKLDREGNISWERSIGNASGELHQLSMQVLADGSWVISGSVSPAKPDPHSLSNTDFDFFLVKLDSNGSVLWEKTYGGPKYEYLLTCLLNPDGGFLLMGYSFSGISGDKTVAHKGGEDIWMIRVDANGTKIWDKALASELRDKLYFALPTSDGGFALLLNSDKMKAGKEVTVYRGYFHKERERKRVGKGFSAVKMDGSGKRQWERKFGLDQFPLSSPQPTESGGLAFLVYKVKPGKKRGLWLVQLKASGKLNREVRFNYQDFEKWASPLQMKFGLYFLKDGGFVVEGKEGANLEGYPNNQIGEDHITSFKIIKYDP